MIYRRCLYPARPRRDDAPVAGNLEGLTQWLTLQNVE